MKRRIFILAFVFIAVVAFREINGWPWVPKHFPKPIYDFSRNPLMEQKIELGRTLFYDPVLSRNNTISCSSCHSQYSAFAHADHGLSHGIDDKIGTRNAPSLMNLAWRKSFMWDGAVHHLDMQSLAPITNPLEMDESIEHVVAKLQASKIYPRLFYDAFGDSIITGEHTLKAITQFMLTLISANSKYDQVKEGLTSFSTQEQNGYDLFKKNCAVCHAEPLFTNDAFMNNGLPIDPTLKDLGRYHITQNPKDSMKFKVPTLRNIEFSYPYMHDGRFRSLSQVLDHYTNGIANSQSLDHALQSPPALTSNERVDLMAFLLTLSDKEFLYNKKLAYPR